MQLSTFFLQYCISGDENATQEGIVKPLIGIPTILAISATLILDIISYMKIKSRTIKSDKLQSNITTKVSPNTLKYSRKLKNMPSKKSNIHISVKSTSISAFLFVSCIILFIIANISSIPSVLVITYTTLFLNSIRVLLIISLAIKKNSTNVINSRNKRLQWEMENAQRERKERLEARKKSE